MSWIYRRYENELIKNEIHSFLANLDLAFDSNDFSKLNDLYNRLDEFLNKIRKIELEV